MTRGGLFRSAGVRFAIVYAVLLAVSAAALAMFLWWATAGLLDRQTEAAINADALGLSERWRESGLPGLVVTIEDRLAQNVDDDAIYLLVDSGMRRIAGNLERWPSVVGVQDAGRPPSVPVGQPNSVSQIFLPPSALLAMMACNCGR